MQVKKNHNIVMFKFDDPETSAPVLIDAVIAAIDVRLFTEVEATSFEFNHGFTSAFDASITQLVGDTHNPVFGNYVLVGYRFDRKRISAAAVNMEYEKKLKKLKLEIAASVKEGATKIPQPTKESKSVLKAGARAKLISATPFSPKCCGVIYDADTGLLLISGASASEADTIVASLSSAMGIPAAQIECINILDYAFMRKSKVTPEMREKFDIAVGSTGVPLSSAAIAEYITHLWFMSETVGDGPQFTTDNHGDVNVTMSADKVAVSKLGVSGSAVGVLSSKEKEHGHIRYKMWHENVPAISGVFNYSGELLPDCSVGMSALSPYFTKIVLHDFFADKDAVSALRKFENDDNFEATVRLYLYAMMAAIEAAADVAQYYILARVSPTRWAAAEGKVLEWLEAYVPECERVQKALTSHAAIAPPSNG